MGVPKASRSGVEEVKADWRGTIERADFKGQVRKIVGDQQKG